MSLVGNRARRCIWEVWSDRMKPATSRVHWHYHYSCTSVNGPKALSLNEHTQSQGPGSPLICCKSLPLSLPLNHRCTDNHTLHLHSTDAPLHWVVHFSREKEFSSLLSMQLSFNLFQNVNKKVFLIVIIRCVWIYAKDQ